MRRAHLLLHLAPPALFAAFGFVVALQREHGATEAFVVVLLGGYLFYAAPHLLWAGLCASVRPSLPAWHAGFFLASAVLAFLGAVSFVSHDPSGLPVQWLLYWPLAGAMLVAVLVVWLLAGRPLRALTIRCTRRVRRAGELKRYVARTKENSWVTTRIKVPGP